VVVAVFEQYRRYRSVARKNPHQFRAAIAAVSDDADPRPILHD
jgi:hypothetical protein